jgi:hypothetical protein
MNRSDLNRRDFHKLSMAALGGLVTGTMAGCSREQPTPPVDAGAPTGTSAVSSGEAPAAGAELTEAQVILTTEPHVCRGLNTCMNKGKSGENACAGQGTCHTANAHTCHYENKCKGQGGCGESYGQNACAMKGECAVPLNDGTWKKARAAFEAAMKAKGNEVGAAPAKS